MNKYRVAFVVLLGLIAVVGREPNHLSVYDRVSQSTTTADQNRSDLRWHWVGLTITCLTARCRYI
jgi:hypothetical protein